MLVQTHDLVNIWNELYLENVLALDTETTGLEHYDVPFGFSLAGKNKAYYFDSRVTPDLFKRFKDFLNATSHTPIYILQNAKFDLRMLLKRDVKIKGIVHELTAAARIHRNDHFGGRAYSLAAQASRFGWSKGTEVEAYIKEHKLYESRKDYFGVEYKVPRYDRVPVDIMSTYATQDARLTYDLWHKYTAKLTIAEYNLIETESAIIDVCMDMEMRGVFLDRTYTLAGYYHYTELVQKHKEEFKQTTKVDYVNSAKSLQKCLQYELPRTEAGAPSLTDDVFEEIKEKGCPADKALVEIISKIRECEKKVSTYYSSYMNLVFPDGSIKPFMYHAGTRTGRFSYGDPNLQNIPKEEKSTEEFVVRGCFKPRPGHIFVSMDYSQMEYKMMAAYANEPSVIKGVMEGMDFHQSIADLVGIPRSSAKTLNFAILYGAGVDKIAGMLGVSTNEAKRLKYKYFMALPKVEVLVDQIIKTGKARGYVTNWAGRKLYADFNHAYALPNHLIQGGGADVVKRAMINIAKTFPDHKMVLQIHDQLVFEMTPEEYDRIPRIKELMETAFPEMNGMKLTVDVSWSDKSLAERDMVKGLPNAIRSSAL